MDHDAAVTEQIEIAIELDHLLLGRVVLSGCVAQHCEVAGYVAATITRLGPEGVNDLVALVNYRRSRKLADVARVVEVHMAKNHVIDVGGLKSSLLELKVDRKIRTLAVICGVVQHGRQRAPIG